MMFRDRLLEARALIPVALVIGLFELSPRLVAGAPRSLELAVLRSSFYVAGIVILFVALRLLRKVPFRTYWLCAAAILFAFTSVSYIDEVHSRFDKKMAFSDIRIATVNSVRNIRDGENPYAVSVDKKSVGNGNEKVTYAGYKYSPATLAFYFLPVLKWGHRGVAIVNLLTMLVLIASCAIAWRRCFTAVLVMASLLLSYPFSAFEYYTKGVIDPLPTALAVLAVLFRHRAVASGVLIGLTISSKLLPGAMVAPFLLHPRQPLRQLTACALTCALFYIPFLAWDAEAFVHNVLMFGIRRSTNKTALLHYVDTWGSAGLSALLLLTLAALLYWVYRSNPGDDRRRWIASTVATSVFVVTNKINHGNYLLWIVPFIAFSIGSLYKHVWCSQR